MTAVKLTRPVGPPQTQTTIRGRREQHFYRYPCARCGGCPLWEGSQKAAVRAWQEHQRLYHQEVTG